MAGAAPRTCIQLVSRSRQGLFARARVTCFALRKRASFPPSVWSLLHGRSQEWLNSRKHFLRRSLLAASIEFV